MNKIKNLTRMARHFKIKFNKSAYGREWRGRKTKIKWTKETIMWNSAYSRAFNLLLKEIGFAKTIKSLECIN